MVNQKMLDYIKQQMLQGISQEQIKNSLMANGWQLQDIEEGFNNIVAQSRPSSFPAVPVASFSGTWKIIAGIVIGVVVLGSGAYLVSQTIFKSKELPKISNEVLNQPSTETPTNTTTLQPSQQPVAQIKSQSPRIVFADCGTILNFQNFDCFVNAAKNCSPAKVTNSTQIDLFGMKTKGTTFYEIKGQQENRCVLYLKTISSNVTFSQELIQKMLSSGATNEQIKQQEQESSKMVQSTVGRDGTCRFASVNDLVNLLNKWKGGSFSSEDFKGVDCRGEYFGQGEQLANTSKTITSEECSAQKGYAIAVADTGTACFKNQIDLGTVVGSLKMNGRYPQCCVSK